VKILQVIPYFYPAWQYGGPVRLAYEMSKRLVQRGHEVIVYTTDALDKHSRLRAQSDTVNVDGVKIYRFRNLSNSLAYDHHLFLTPGMIPVAKREMQTFDVVHLHEYRTLQNLVVCHYARRYHTPYIIQANGSLPRIAAKRGLKQLYDILWGSRLVKEASKVIAVSSIEAKQCEAIGIAEDRVHVIYPGIELAEYKTLPPKGTFRTRYGIDSEEKVILYLGRIHEIKGLGHLVRVFSDLAKQVNNTRLVIAGSDDGYLSTLEKLVSALGIHDRVLFTGPLYERAKLEAYVDADVFVLPSVYDIFGVSVLEACACGTPVIVTDRCGIAESIAGRAGYVVPFDDKDKFRDALVALLTDQRLRQQFGQGGQRLVRDEFDWSKVIAELEKVYADAAGVRGG